MLAERPGTDKEADMFPQYGLLNDLIGRGPEILGCVEYLLGSGGVIHRTDKKIGRASDLAEVHFPAEDDNYLADLIVAIDDLGGFFNLSGLCQGGWMAAMPTARFPEKVNSLESAIVAVCPA